MKIIKLAVVSLALVLGACASGVKHKDMASSIPAVKADQGRIYFFRSASMLGAAIQPSITLNGATVGDSKPGGFFYVDSKPGNQEVSTSTEVEKKLTFTLDKGEVRYVKTSPSFGVMVGRIVPELVSATEAQKEIADLSFTGIETAKK